MLVNTRKTYGLVAQLLHWTTAVLILLLLAVGLYMHELPIDTPEQLDGKIWLYSLHKTLGIAALLVAITRVVWAVYQPRPVALHGDRRQETLLAETIHWLLYAAIILMPVTGWLHHAALEGFAPIWWPLSQDLPFIPKNEQLAAYFGNAHFFTAIVLMGSVFLHVAGALKHAVIDRDQTLARMLPGKKVSLPGELKEPDHKKKPAMMAGSVIALLLAAIVSIELFERQNESAVLPSSTTSSGWTVDHEKSRLEIVVVQSGNPVSGHFEKWEANINFDPDNLEAASVVVNVDVSSLSLGSITAQAISSDFLHVEQFPVAVFSSEKFSLVGENSYVAEGELNLLGNVRPISLPFDLNIENGRAVMSGTAEIQRLDFGLGEKGFKTDGILGFAVQVNVALEANQN
ncbi:MAG: cytochrome b/b6 domain-containing protein [Pseudomonadota bacterium]